MKQYVVSLWGGFVVEELLNFLKVCLEVKLAIFQYEFTDEFSQELVFV